MISGQTALCSSLHLSSFHLTTFFSFFCHLIFMAKRLSHNKASFHYTCTQPTLRKLKNKTEEGEKICALVIINDPLPLALERFRSNQVKEKRVESEQRRLFSR